MGDVVDVGDRVSDSSGKREVATIELQYIELRHLHVRSLVTLARKRERA